MDTPLIDRYVGHRAENFANAKTLLERALSDHHIWNTEFESAKYTISRTIEEALDKSSAPYREPRRGGGYPQWEENDPRWNVIYHPAPMNAPGAVKKLQKFKGKEGAEFDHFIATLEECAKLAELMKSVKPYIQKGRKPSENPKEIDLTQTGHCPVCGRRQKLSKELKMVDHGFEISDGIHYFGQRVGHCFGVGYAAYELSKDGCQAFKEYLVPQLERTKAQLKELKSGRVQTVSEMTHKREGSGWKDVLVTYNKGENGFDRVLQIHVGRAEQQCDNLESDIAAMDARIQNWTAKPLEFGTYADQK